MKQHLSRIKASKIFSDFSFDYKGVYAMKKFGESVDLRWNVWNVKPDNWKDIERKEKYGFIIFDSSDDPNTH